MTPRRRPAERGGTPGRTEDPPKGNASVRGKAQCCPNCDTVMVLHYDPDQADAKWYECSLCGHRTDAESFRSIEDEDIQRRPYAH